MKRRITTLISSLSLIVLGVAGVSPFATAAGEQAAERQDIDAMERATMKEFTATVDGARKLADSAEGHAVFRATKGGLVVTGAGGTGVAVDDTNGARTYMHMGAGGIGLGAGIQSYRLVLLFETRQALDHFIDEGWDAATSAQAAAGKAGVNATSSFVDGVAVYQLTDKGLMAQADLSGTHFWKSEKLNPGTSSEEATD